MPLDAWVLLLVAVGSGLGLELWFHRAQRRRMRRREVDDRPGDPPDSAAAP